MDFFNNYPLEIGIFIVLICKILILIEVITANKSENNKSKFMTWKLFLKKYLFLVVILIYGISLIFRNI